MPNGSFCPVASLLALSTSSTEFSVTGGASSARSGMCASVSGFGAGALVSTSPFDALSIATTSAGSLDVKSICVNNRRSASCCHGSRPIENARMSFATDMQPPSPQQLRRPSSRDFSTTQERCARRPLGPHLWDAFLCREVIEPCPRVVQVANPRWAVGLAVRVVVRARRTAVHAKTNRRRPDAALRKGQPLRRVVLSPASKDLFVQSMSLTIPMPSMATFGSVPLYFASNSCGIPALRRVGKSNACCSRARR